MQNFQGKYTSIEDLFKFKYRFNGSRAVLSGPAGGVVGYAVTTYNENNQQPVIGN